MYFISWKNRKEAMWRSHHNLLNRNRLFCIRQSIKSLKWDRKGLKQQKWSTIWSCSDKITTGNACTKTAESWSQNRYSLCNSRWICILTIYLPIYRLHNVSAQLESTMLYFTPSLYFGDMYFPVTFPPKSIYHAWKALCAEFALSQHPLDILSEEKCTQLSEIMPNSRLGYQIES